MPTVYTSCIENRDITELKDYMLNCSKNFGCLIYMSDNNNIQVKKKEIDDYYLKRLNEVKNEFEKFLKLSEEEIQNQIDELYNDKLKEQQEGLKKFEKGKQKYLDMLEKVKSWTPPTNNHTTLKTFAIKQLEECLDLDYNDNIKYYYLQKLSKDNIKEYKYNKLKSYLKAIECNSKQYRQEIEQVEITNKWIDDLINSFD